MKREPNKIIEEVYEALTKHSGEAMSINRIAKESGLHYNTVRNYVKLIKRAQSLPEIEVIKSGRTTIVRSKGLLSLPEEEQLKIIRNDFPSPDNQDKLFINLLKSNAVSKYSAIKIPKTPLIEKLIHQGHVAETKDGRVYLTKTGKIIAGGAVKIYPAVV
jgi:predicted transcriptional regulator